MPCAPRTRMAGKTAIKIKTHRLSRWVAFFRVTKNGAGIFLLRFWSRRRDLNPRPLGPEPSALPNCATPRLRCILYQRRRGFASDFAEHLKMWRAFVCSLLQRWYKKASLLHNPTRCVTMFYGKREAGAPVNTVRYLFGQIGRAEGRKQPCSGIIFCSSCSPRSL